MRDPEHRSARTVDEARHIAEQMEREVRQPSDPNNRDATSAAVGSQSETDPDEDRIERALIDEGIVSPEQTAVGTREADERDT